MAGTEVESARIRRERRTFTAMIRLYCRDRHGGRGGLCAGCQGLLGFAMQRIDRCPFGDEKPTCANCPIHCYRKDRREEVREVMRYAGPRMLARHPILALLHQLDGRRRVELPRRAARVS